MGVYLDHHELLYSTQGVVYGAGYTADHVTRISLLDHGRRGGGAVRACWRLFFRPRFRTIVIGFGIYVGLYFIGRLAGAGSFSEGSWCSRTSWPRNSVSQEQHRI